VRRTVLALLALLCTALALPIATAQADASRDVGLTGFADLVVDRTHGHVFISQNSGTVIVTDLAGRPVGTLEGLPGANGMTLNDDGSRLYIAVTGADEIAQVDTAAPFAAGAVTTFPTGAGTCPLDVAYTAGLVWYAATCDGQWADVQPLDPATGTIFDTGSLVVYNPRLASSPSVPNGFFAGDRGSSPAELYKYSVTGLPDPTVTRTSDWDVNGSSMAFTQDGSAVVTGGDQELSTTDLSITDSYAVSHPTNAVAMRSSDDLIAFGTTDGVVFYRHGAATRMGTYRFDDPDAAVVDGGLAFGASTLYAVTYDSQFTPHYALQVITPRNRPRANVSVAVSGRHHRYGKRATVTVTLHGHKSTSRLELYAATPDGKLYFLKRGRPDSLGQLTMRPYMSVNAVFIGVFDGDATVAANGAAKRVKVQAWVVGKLFKAKRHAGHYALYKPSQKAVYGAAVGPNKKGQCLYFRAQFHVHGHWGRDSTTSCVPLNKKSAAGAYLQGSRQLAGIPIRFRAEWSGDSLNTRANSKWSYAKFTGSARTASKLGTTYGALPAVSASPSTVTPKIRLPFSQHTARSQSSPSSSLVNPLSWLS
jgi:hypothetical protein